jgi:hypothetical protein
VIQSPILWEGATSHGKTPLPAVERVSVGGVSELDVDRAAILAQLERILANSLFKNSRRYPNLLRYVVERTLDGHHGELKERTLGIEVFGRQPDYDTNLDPVVRTTAAEIRKRLAQYYKEPDHEFEVRIDLPLGSYVATFHPARDKSGPAGAAAQIRPEAAVAVPVVAVPVAPAPAVSPHPKRILRVTAFAGIVLAVNGLIWVKVSTSRSALDRLWGPVLESSSPVLLCVGQRPFVGLSAAEPKSALAQGQNTASAETTLFQLYYLGTQNVAMPDVSTMGRLAGLLQAKGKPYHIRGESSTTFEDVRDGPVVLIGAFNNDWSLRLMGPQRFSFERDGDIFWIKDQQNPSDKSHAVDYATPYLRLTEDYALISRVLDPVTERMVVLAGGLTGYGTIAAGEFLTHPAYVDAITSRAPRNWEHKNVQIVISTKVINGKSGPPKLLMAHFW